MQGIDCLRMRRQPALSSNFRRGTRKADVELEGTFGLGFRCRSREGSAVPPERIERKLAAILAADVAGYSRLMGADEEGTLARLKACRRELMDPEIAEHRGRVVKTTGDGILIEFSSVVDAVRCAMDVQRGMAERNANVTDEQRIEFRVGINLGDIMIDAEDVHGDGVNIAARLKSIAEPGGICISDSSYQQVRDKFTIHFEDMGVQQLTSRVRCASIAYRLAGARQGKGRRSPCRTSPRSRYC